MAASAATSRDVRTGDRTTTPTTRLSTETKHSSKTSELWVWALATAGILIAGVLTKAGDGHDDRLTSSQVWLYVAIVTGAYLISRGLAKSGSREPYWSGDDDGRGR
jgi:hypothetical protein